MFRFCPITQKCRVEIRKMNDDVSGVFDGDDIISHGRLTKDDYVMAMVDNEPSSPAKYY